MYCYHVMTFNGTEPIAYRSPQALWPAVGRQVLRTTKVPSVYFLEREIKQVSKKRKWINKRTQTQRGLRGDYYSLYLKVPSTKAAKKPTLISVNSSNSLKRKQKEVEKNYWKNSLKGSKR